MTGRWAALSGRHMRQGAGGWAGRVSEGKAGSGDARERLEIARESVGPVCQAEWRATREKRVGRWVVCETGVGTGASLGRWRAMGGSGGEAGRAG